MRIGKLLLVIAAFIIAAVLASCGGSQGEGQATSSNDVQAPTPTTSSGQQAQQNNCPKDKTLKITVPSMSRLNNSPVPDTTGDDEDALKNHVGIHLQGTGFPCQSGSNVYIAGHRLGYPATPSWLAFWDLNKPKEGDMIYLEDANGAQYNYKIYKIFEVAPTDLSVTDPVQGKSVVSLQSCTLPDYSNRLIVQGELQA